MPRRKKIHHALELDTTSDEELLDIRLCDLGLTIQGTHLETCVERFYDELQLKGFKSVPTCYLGDEWFSPAGVPAIAIPFYLAHPRLQQLEQRMMLEVEGSNDRECLKLLRHECGHAIIHAFRLTRRPAWIGIFGDAGQDYDDYYRYQPYSRSYVQNLKNWYAQSHPEEDFAETFAVWLGKKDWREFYRDWPALKKLEYVDELMQELKGRSYRIKTRHLLSNIQNLKSTLRMHYEKKKKLYGQDEEEYFDDDLAQIFYRHAPDDQHVAAGQYLRRNHSMILHAVSKWTQEGKFVIKQLLARLIRRCEKLELTRRADDETALIHFIAYLTAITSHHRYTSRYKGRK